jgi:hypothetical protein
MVRLLMVQPPALPQQVAVKHKQRVYIRKVKPTTCTSFSIYLFLRNSLHVSDGLPVHHQEFRTVHTATGICQTDMTTCLLA